LLARDRPVRAAAPNRRGPHRRRHRPRTGQARRRPRPLRRRLLTPALARSPNPHISRRARGLYLPALFESPVAALTPLPLPSSASIITPQIAQQMAARINDPHFSRWAARTRALR